MAFQGGFADLANWLATEGNDVPEFFTNAGNLMLVTAAVGGVIMWSIIHSVFVKPFVLVGVLRNYIASGKGEKFSESDFDELDKKSAKFKKIHAEAK